MVIICHRTLPAYMPYYSAFCEERIESRMVVHYLDLAVPNEILSKKLFDGDRSKNNSVMDLDIMQQFNPDDCIYVNRCGRRRDFFSQALSKKEDRIERQLFDLFYHKRVLRNISNLESGEFVVRFLNMVTVFGVEKWRETDIRSSERHPVVERLFWSIYPTILKGIYKKKSEHPLLVKKFWDLFCATDQTRHKMFEFVPDAEYLEFMLEVANRTRFDFWGMRNGSNKFTERVVLSYIRLKKFEFLEILLKYGFALEKGIPMETRKMHWCYPLSSSYLIFDWDVPISNKFLMWFLTSVYATHPHLDIVELPGCIELYQKLHLSLPQPSEPPSVFRKNLQRVFSYHTVYYAAGRLDAVPRRSPVEDMTEAYLKCDVHPSESNGVMTPLTLSHLSRCVIRERLADNYQLPTAIGESYLPTLIKSFLRLEF